MSLLNDLEGDLDAMKTMVDITGIFKGIASIRIAEIKDRVQHSQEFFNQLWHIYTQIRVDELFHFGRSQRTETIIEKELLIIITAEGGFSGDIDQKLIAWVLKSYKPEHNDIVVIGHHGVIQLAQAGIKVKRSFKMPEQDENINVVPLIEEIQQYASTTVYYQTYVSLMVQDVKKMSLSTAVAEQGKVAGDSKEVINEKTYIFEPSTYAVVDHLESSMIQIVMSQLIMESKLAQYASRFQAMSRARDKADESYGDLNTLFARARRHIKDERLKEIINGLRKATA